MKDQSMVGKRFRRMAVIYRVMAQSEGYVMLRAKGAIPFVESVRFVKLNFVEV